MTCELYLGDCLEQMAMLPDASIDAIICDPPYGTTASKWDSVIPLHLMWKELERIVKPHSAIVLCAAQPFTSVLITSNLSKFRYTWVWEKEHGANIAQTGWQPLKVHEDIVVFSKIKPFFIPQKTEAVKPSTRHLYAYKRTREDRIDAGGIQQPKHSSSYEPDKLLPKSIVYIPRDLHKNVLHPSQKPVALMSYLISSYTNEGDIVLDFTFGSGTTGVACVETDRNFIGIEKDEKYFNIGVERIQKALDKQKEAEVPV